MKTLLEYSSTCRPDRLGGSSLALGLPLEGSGLSSLESECPWALEGPQGEDWVQILLC